MLRTTRPQRRGDAATLMGSVVVGRRDKDRLIENPA